MKSTSNPPFSEQEMRERLALVIDPELHIDIVSMGLIYDVSSQWHESEAGKVPQVHVLMTLTTPGCPLSAVFDTMVREALQGLPGLDVDHHVYLELTFDPPWLPDMMTAEARAELGFD